MKLLVIFVSFLVSLSAERKLPSYIHICHPKHEDVSKCIMDNLNIIRPKIRNGIPELLIPPNNPYRVPFAQAKIGETIIGSLKDIKVWIKDIIVQDFKVDLEDFSLKIKLLIPEVKGEADYKVHGKVLILNLDGHGLGQLNLYNLTAEVEAQGKIETKKGKRYIVPTNITIKPAIENMYIHLENLFPQHPELTDQANKLFNDNQKVLYDEFSPFALNVVKRLISEYINTFFSAYSYDVLFPDD